MLTVLVLLLIIAVLAGLFWLLRRQQTSKRRPPRTVTPKEPASPGRHTNLKAAELEKIRKNAIFWGVEIRQAGCAAARELAGRNFTFDEAPALPLDGCSATMCSCLYIGLQEKRQQQRRRYERRTQLRFEPDKPDRREHKDRRRGEKWRGRDL